MKPDCIGRGLAAGLLWSATVSVLPAQATTDTGGGDLLVRVQGPIAVAPTDTLGTLVVIGHEAIIAGTVRHRLIVVKGTARIDGRVGGITVFSGHVELGPTARVSDDVLLYGSTIVRANDAVIGGTVHDEAGPSFSASALWLLWASVTFAVMLAGLVFATLWAPAMTEASRVATRAVGPTVLTALVLMFGLPAVALLSVMTGVGVIFGLLVMLVMVPALVFLGYLVSSLAVGRTLLGTSDDTRRGTFSAIAAGVLILQLAALIPIIGAVLVFVAAHVGAGALVYRAWRQQRERAGTPAPQLVSA